MTTDDADQLIGEIAYLKNYKKKCFLSFISEPRSLVWLDYAFWPKK